MENNINRLKTDQNSELQKSKQSEERLKNSLNELEKRVNNEYLQKSEHYQIVADLETLIETLKNEIEEKENTFHQEIMKKQGFYEEKFAKDLELLQNNAQSIK